MNLVRSLLTGPLLAAVSLLTLSPLGAASTPEDPYSLAVASYVEAATNELNAIRAAGEASKQALPEESRARFRGFEARMKTCEQILEELRAAPPATFDATKVRYEAARAEVVRELTRAQKT